MSLLVDIEKNFGAFKLAVNFEAEDNKTLALLGASGCGKSLTLRCIAGIITPDKGKIILDGRTLFSSYARINLPPQKRKCGLMFQNYALFPNMTVEQNISVAAKDKSQVGKMLALFGLSEVRKNFPAQISGGQQQRTALARMLISEPDALMFDEPFSALDSHLRFRTEQEVRRVTKNFAGPVLLVSHNRDEVFRMSDSIAVMNAGAIDVIGNKREVFSNTRTKAAAILTGCKNISAVERASDKKIFASDWGISLSLSLDDGNNFVGIRMNDIVPATEDGENVFSYRVLETVENPFSVILTLRPFEAPEKSTPIFWEVSSKFWNEHKSDIVKISMPEKFILKLR